MSFGVVFHRRRNNRVRRNKDGRSAVDGIVAGVVASNVNDGKPAGSAAERNRESKKKNTRSRMTRGDAEDGGEVTVAQ